LKGSDCKQSFHAEYIAFAQNKRQQAFISAIPTGSNLIYIHIVTLSPEKKGGKTGETLNFSGDIPDPPGQGPAQPAVGDPASAGALDWVTHRGSFQSRPFCDSV